MSTKVLTLHQLIVCVLMFTTGPKSKTTHHVYLLFIPHIKHQIILDKNIFHIKQLQQSRFVSADSAELLQHATLLNQKHYFSTKISRPRNPLIQNVSKQCVCFDVVIASSWLVSYEPLTHILQGRNHNTSSMHIILTWFGETNHTKRDPWT